MGKPGRPRASSGHAWVTMEVLQAAMVVVLLALTSAMAVVRVAMAMEKKTVVLVVLPMMADVARMVIMMDAGVGAVGVEAGRITPRALGR